LDSNIYFIYFLVIGEEMDMTEIFFSYFNTYIQYILLINSAFFIFIFESIHFAIENFFIAHLFYFLVFIFIFESIQFAIENFFIAPIFYIPVLIFEI